MSVTAEFKAMVERAWDAIDYALAGNIAEGVKDILQETIFKNVYAYPASVWAMEKRRYDDGGLGERENMIATVIDIGSAGRTDELQVESFAGFQDIGPNFRGGFVGIGPEFNTGSIGARLDEVVETGDPTWRQPYPRPFYKEAEKKLVDSGYIERELRYRLVYAGFEVE